MPAAAPILVSAALTTAGYTAATVAVATITSAVAVGAYERSRARRKARDAYNKSQQDRLVTVRSGVSTRKYVVGTHRVGGTLMYVDSIGPNQTMLDSIVALAANRCECIGYYFNDEHIAVADWPGGKFASVDTRRGSHRTPTEVGPGVTAITIDRVPLAGTVMCTPYVANPGDNGFVTLAPISVVGTTVTVDLPAAAFVDVTYAYESSTSKLRPQYMSGAADQPASTWNDVAAPGWTADHKLSGIANIRALMTWDEKVYAAGAPQVSCVLLGGGVDVNGASQHLLYDPRDGSHPAYSDNPALVALWWATLPRKFGGCGIPLDWIDLELVKAAANVCWEFVWMGPLYPGGENSYMPRYQCHSVLDTADSPWDNLRKILSSMDGDFVFSGGKYRMFAGAFRPATVTITDDDIVANKPITMVTASNDVPINVVTATINDYSKGWVESSPPSVRNAAYVAADGAETSFDLQLEATTDPRQANYLMGVALEKGRPHFTCTLTVGGIGEDLALLDTVELDIENRPQYAGKTFEVRRITDHWNGTFELQLVETKPTTWTLNPANYLPTGQGAAPDTSYLWNVARVMSLAVSYGEPQVIGGGLTMTRMTITWDQHSQQYVRDTGRIELRYREIGTDDWRGIPEVPGNAVGTQYTAALKDGATYEIQARARNGAGAVSDWASTLDAVNGVLAAGQLRIAASSISFHIDAFGVGSPSIIELTAVLSGPLQPPITWAVVGAHGATLTPVDDYTVRLSYADMAGRTAAIRASAEYRGVEFSDLITIVKVTDGLTGPRGEAGAVGSLTGYGSAYNIHPAAWNDQLANRVIYNMLTNGTATTPLADTSHLLIGDTVTLSNGANFAQTRFWDGVSSWLIPGMVIDGNLLVNGTVSATKVTAGVIQTGALGNARINIGDTSFVGSLGGTVFSSPLHVEKVSGKDNQVLISALNDKDTSAAIWGINGVPEGNAVTGTWHASTTDLQYARWQLIGVLGGALSQFGAAVAGSAYGQKKAGSFNYYSGANSASPGVLVTAFGVSDATRAAWAAGAVELTGDGSPLRVLGSSDGEAGQVLVSRGAGKTPTWGSLGGGGSVDYASIKTILGGTTGSALTLTTTFRSTGINVPTAGSGVELSYDASIGGGTGLLTAYDRTGGGARKRLELVGTAIYLNASATIDLTATPAFPTRATTDFSTFGATTAFVANRIAQDAPTKSGSGATGTWSINISGNAASATNAANATNATTAANANAVGGRRVASGSITTNVSGDVVINTGLSSIEGLGFAPLDGYVIGVSSVVGGSVAIKSRKIYDGTGAVAGSVTTRWTATGT